MFGYLETTFSFGMLVGGPLFGRFGDIFGARMALTLALVSSSTTYFILSAADSIPLLFLSRIPGVFMHVFHGAQMVMTDVSGADGACLSVRVLGHVHSVCVCVCVYAYFGVFFCVVWVVVAPHYMCVYVFNTLVYSYISYSCCMSWDLLSNCIRCLWC